MFVLQMYPSTCRCGICSSCRCGTSLVRAQPATDLTPPTVVVHLGVQTLELTRGAEGELPLAHKRMTLAGRQHILVAVEHHPHRSAQLLGRQRERSRKRNGTRLLTTEATTESLDSGHDTVVWNAKIEAQKTCVSDGFCVDEMTSISESSLPGITRQALVSR